MKVSGGARGLGLAVAKGMLEHGLSKLALVDVDLREGWKAVQALQADFIGREDDIVFRPLDVTQGEDISRVIRDVVEMFERIDVLLCFAGIVDAVRAIEYEPESFRKIYDVNTIGTFLTAQAVGR